MYHYHKCLECNCEWRHVLDRKVSSAQYQENHTCTGCGKDKRIIHRYRPATLVEMPMLDLKLLIEELLDKAISEDRGAELAEDIARQISTVKKITFLAAMDIVIRNLRYAYSHS